jgi:DNA primase small subunit
MRNESISVVKSAFKAYYFNHLRLIEEPEHIEQREFGYKPFESGMVRHLSYRNKGDLIATLIRNVPADLYCSNALYRYPTYPMQAKEWLGADLIFDIDGKDLHLPCHTTHSYSICSRCNQASNGKCDLCEHCKFDSLDYTTLPCNKCIQALKKEVKHLIDLLTDDLGLDEKSISVYFSGNNGFHIVASDESFRPLTSEARSDIVSYLIGTNFLAENIGIRKGKGPSSSSDFVIKFPKSGLSYGWRRRIADKFGIDQTSTAKLSNIVQHTGGYESFKSELAKITKTLGVITDPQVTMDIHRIFRMPGSINSKSGLTKLRCNDLESCDPLNDACLLGSTEVKVNLKIARSSRLDFTLKGKLFKLKESQLELPLFAAVYLCCKGLADITN